MPERKWQHPHSSFSPFPLPHLTSSLLRFPSAASRCIFFFPFSFFYRFKDLFSFWGGFSFLLFFLNTCARVSLSEMTSSPLPVAPPLHSSYATPAREAVALRRWQLQLVVYQQYPPPPPSLKLHWRRPSAQGTTKLYYGHRCKWSCPGGHDDLLAPSFISLRRDGRLYRLGASHLGRCSTESDFEKSRQKRFSTPFAFFFFCWYAAFSSRFSKFDGGVSCCFVIPQEKKEKEKKNLIHTSSLSLSLWSAQIQKHLHLHRFIRVNIYLFVQI